MVVLADTVPKYVKQGAHAMRAAVQFAAGDDRLIVRDDLVLAGPGPGEVRVRIRATGVCHSDLSAMTGVLPQPMPFVPGHEGAGEVVAVGEGVTRVAEGDHVIICWSPPCGECKYCATGQGNLCVKIFFGMAGQAALSAGRRRRLRLLPGPGRSPRSSSCPGRPRCRCRTTCPSRSRP